MAIIFSVFPAERRGMAMGVFGLGVVFAPAIGPTMGGLMIEYFSWRYVFYISLPFCALAAVLGLFFMPTRPMPREIPPFDWLGFFLTLRRPARADDRHRRRPAARAGPPTPSCSGGRGRGRHRGLHLLGAAHAPGDDRHPHLRQPRVLGGGR
jgi:MFS family permease